VTCIGAQYHLISGRLDIVSKPSFTAPKICRFGFRRTVEKFVDSDANSESVTTLFIMYLHNNAYILFVLSLCSMSMSKNESVLLSDSVDASHLFFDNISLLGFNADAMTKKYRIRFDR